MNSSVPPCSNPAIEMAIAFYRDPLALREWSQSMPVLPDGLTEVLRIAGTAPASLRQQAQACGVTNQELQQAARFLLQQLLFAPGSGHYRVLGVEPDAGRGRIREHHRLLMRLFHPDRHAGTECWTDAYAARINRAYNVLRNPASRRAYDRAHPVSTPASPVSPAPIVTPGLRPGAARAFRRQRYWRRNPRSWRASELGWRRHLLVAVGLCVAVLLVFWGSDLARAPLDSSVGQAGAGFRPVLTPMSERTQGDVRPGFVSDAPPLPAQPQPLLRSSPQVRREMVESDRPAAALDGAGDGTGDSGVSVAGQAVGRLAQPITAPPPRQVVVPRLAEPESSRAPTVEADPNPDRPVQRPGEEGALAGTLVEISDAGRAASSPAQSSSDVEAEQSAPNRHAAELMAGGEAEGMALAGRLANSYRNGDLGGFVALFAHDARTSDEDGRESIEDGYRELFATTAERDIRFSGMLWSMDGDRAAGEGRVSVLLKRHGESAPEHFTGRLRMEVGRGNAGFWITGLYYDLERQTSP